MMMTLKELFNQDKFTLSEIKSVYKIDTDVKSTTLVKLWLGKERWLNNDYTFISWKAFKKHSIEVASFYYLNGIDENHPLWRYIDWEGVSEFIKEGYVELGNPFTCEPLYTDLVN